MGPTLWHHLILGALCLGCSPGSCSQLPPSNADSSPVCYFPRRPEEGPGQPGFANRRLRISKHTPLGADSSSDGICELQFKQGACSGSCAAAQCVSHLFVCIYTPALCGVEYVLVSESLHAPSSVPGLHS